MTPTLNTVAKTFAEVANKRKIDLTKVDEEWLKLIMGATQICHFKTKKIFLHYVNMAMDKAESNFCSTRQPNASKPLLNADWLPVSEELPKKGVIVLCKLSKDIGLGKTEKKLYRMKHNGRWNDYHDLVTHWKPISV